MQKEFGDAFPKESAADMISTFLNSKRVRDVHVHHLHLTDEGHGGDGLCPLLVLKELSTHDCGKIDRRTSIRVSPLSNKQPER